MKINFKHLKLWSLGFVLLGSNAFAAANECYSPTELNDFKSLYVKLQQQLNYEGKDAYLDKNFVVQLKPHEKNAPYPGKEFEDALFNEYQNSLRKVGKLYQAAKFEGDDGFKSNDLLVNFMKSIDDKSSDSSNFVNKTKIKDVINALEEASKKKYGNSKFAINDGDKYLLEKLLTHAQDRICSVNKYEETHKGTALFKADYLEKVRSAPLNVLINSIKNASIEKDSKIDLKPASDLTASLVDPNVAVKSAIADNLNQLSAWVKKVKASGPNCLASIKSKDFAGKIQGQIQGCNYGQFIETLSQDNVNNLESVLHFINANEKLLNRAAAKAETNSDELKLEGFVSQAFANLGTAVRCAEFNPENSSDKKVFIRNLPYNQKSNQFDTSGIICKSNSKILGADSCRKQFDLSSDSLGRGLEIKAKKGAFDNLTFSVKDSESCADISFKNPNAPVDNHVELASITTLEQCVAQKKPGSVFNWDTKKKSCGEFSALLADAALKQAAQQCVVQKKNGYDYKWDSSKNSCDEIPTIAGTKLESKISCDAKSAANLPYKWNSASLTCDSAPVLTAAEQKAKIACESAPTKNGFSNSWNNQSRQCALLEIAKVPTIEQCVALKKAGSVFNWDAANKSCGEFSALLSEAALKQAAQQCAVKGSSFKWNSSNKECVDVTAKNIELKNISSIEQCVALKKEGSVFNWDASKKSCNEFSSLLSNATLKQSAQLCEVKQKEGSSFKWDTTKNACSEFPTIANTKNTIGAAELAKVSTLEQCVALTKPGSVFNWNSSKNSCIESSALLTNAVSTQTSQQCVAQKKNGYEYKWDSSRSACNEIPTIAGTKLQAKIACDAKSAAGFPFKWNTSEFLCEKTNGDSRTPAQLDSNVIITDKKDLGEKSPAIGTPDLKTNAVTTKSESKPTSAAMPVDVNEKSAKIACETKSLPGNMYRWNSATKSCEAPAAGMASGSKAPSTKPIILTTDPVKPTTKAPNPPIVGTKTPDVSTKDEIKNTPVTKPISQSQNSDAKSDVTTNTPPLSNLPDGNIHKDKLDCETQEKEGFAYKWFADSSKCIEQTVEVAKIDCEANKKEGFEFKWLSDSVKCIEVPANNTADKKDEKKEDIADKALVDAENECIADNTKWIDEKNDGRPGIRYEWDSEKKSCIDKRPDKDGEKKVTEEEAPAMEAPSNPKRAPARFVPINIPSRQIYLMPGMP